jgi:hypothetical protein
MLGGYLKSRWDFISSGYILEIAISGAVRWRYVTYNKTKLYVT